ncbi:hypothetical protein ABEB36_015016 [Hypothenemus hampei]|uniref:Uncharacterized protein n=1 Tax=Hypothenemus hampei TaxID=57062 RepID=A0ABD1E1L1_HYPHA
MGQGSDRKIWELSLLALLYVITESAAAISKANPTLHSSQVSNLTDISVRNTCMTSHANEVQLFSGVPEVVSGDESISLQQEIISDVNTKSKPESSHVKTSKRSYFKSIADLEKRTASPRKLKLMAMVVRREDHIRKLKYLCKRRAHNIKALSDLSDSDVVRSLFKGMPNATANFLVSQLRCAKKKSRGRR